MPERVSNFSRLSGLLESVGRSVSSSQFRCASATSRSSGGTFAGRSGGVAFGEVAFVAAIGGTDTTPPIKVGRDTPAPEGEPPRGRLEPTPRERRLSGAC